MIPVKPDAHITERPFCSTPFRFSQDYPAFGPTALFGGRDVTVANHVLLLGFGRLVESVLDESVSLHLFGLVVQQNSHEHQDRPDRRHRGDGVAEHDDAQPDGQRVFHGAGNTKQSGHTPSVHSQHSSTHRGRESDGT